VSDGNTIGAGVKRLLGWVGLICLILIIPVKAMRFADLAGANAVLMGVAPSLLGPAGLFLLIVSGSGRLSRLPLPTVTALVAAIALGLEFAQLLPRPGILSKVHYTFDWLDVLASLVSVGCGSLVAFIAAKRNRAPTGDAPKGVGNAE
jgi:hypothetical protein